MNPLAIKALGTALAVVAVFAAGWTVADWRWSAKWEAAEAARATAALQADLDARDKETSWADRVAAIDAAHTKEMTEKTHEIDALRADVDRGVKRLRVAAVCPGAKVPGSSTGSGLGDGGRAELGADARPDYYALRAGLDRLSQKLSACQAVLRGERTPAP